jgi:hypothetical protein
MGVKMLYRTSWITYYQLSQIEGDLATLSLNLDTSKYSWLEDLSPDDKSALFKMGFDAADKMIKKNKALLLSK